MPRTASRNLLMDTQRAFTGGLNTVSSDFLIEPTQIRLATNAILTQYGDITRRLGSKSMTTALPDADIDAILCWRTAGTHEYLVVSNGHLYSLGTYSPSVMTPTDKGVIAVSTPVSMVAFRDGTGEAAYIGSGTQLYKYIGGTLSAVAGTPALRQLAVYNQRLFGITGADQTIHYSSLNNGDSCGVVSGTSGNAVVRTFGNQKLTALLTLKNSLALFHVSGVSRFTGLTQDDIAIGSGAEGISTETGTVAPKTAVAVEGIGYFLSERGAFAISDDGVIALDSPTTPDPTVPLLAAMTAPTIQGCAAVHDKATRTIRFRLSNSTGAYFYHYRLRAWSGPHLGDWIGARVFAEGVDENGVPIIVGSGVRGFLAGTDAATAGQLRRYDMPGVYKDNVRNDGTAGFTTTMNVKLRRFLTGSPDSEKAWRQAYIFADLAGSTTAKLYWQTSAMSGDVTPVTPSGGGFTTPAFSMDLSALVRTTLWGAPTTWGAFEFADTVTERALAVPLCGRGTFLDLLFTDTSAVATRLSRVDIDAYDYGIRF